MHGPTCIFWVNLTPFSLKTIEWFRVVLDECHAIKETNTKQSKFALALQAERRWAVTGTVMQTKHDDLAAIVRFLRLAPFDTTRVWNAYFGGANLDLARAFGRAKGVRPPSPL
jgi:SNF2 family DNA or RNA helicase